MKRLISALAVLALLLPLACAAEGLPDTVLLRPGASRTLTLPYEGYWESDDESVAYGRENTIVAVAEGFATLTLVSAQGAEWQLAVEVSQDAPEDASQADDVPAVIREAIRIGLREWEENKGKTFSKEPKHNKYTKWWGYACGWCGAFVGYCLDMAGVPLEPTDTFRKVKPHAGGVPYGVREAAVPKLDTAFTNMERVTNIPRPGYLVIYGQRDYYAFVHVGLVTDVVDRGDGVYQVFTVEGNMSSRIKRYCYLYDSNAKADRNMSATPENERTEPDVFQYTPHKNNWYVNEFCQTWY